MSEIGRRKGDNALVAALAGGATVRDAAQSAGVSERTAHRRLEDPAFARRVTDARSEMLSRAVGTLARTSTAAATALALLLRAESETVRLGAARSILELAAKFHETEQLEHRIAQLEAQMEGQQRKGARVWRA